MGQATPPVQTSVSQALIHYLSIEKVTHVFGIPGGGLATLLVAFKNSDKSIQYVVCRHETGAAYMADGYYRARGDLGVVMVTTGPGATNALTGVMNAQNDGSAVLLITGEVNENYFGMGYLQEGADAKLNVDGIYDSCLDYSAMITAASNAETLIKQALRDALSLPRNAAHLAFPNDVAGAIIPQPMLPASPTQYRAEGGGAPSSTLRAALASLYQAKRPLILLGNGCRQALSNPDRSKKLQEWADTYGIPIMTTADGKGIFPESHDMSLRAYGIAGCEWPYYWMVTEAGETPYDGLMVIGSSLGELATNKWLPILIPQNNGPFVQVDLNQAVLGRSFQISQGVVAEAGAFIDGMYDLMPEYIPDPKDVEARKGWLAAIKQAHGPFASDEQYQSNASPAEPAALMRVLQNTLPADQKVKIFLDAGNCVGWGVHYLSVSDPWQIHSSLSMGPMGFGIGAALGAKFACPTEICIGIVGDGAFLMYGAEVSTASQYQQGVIYLVLNDNNLNMVSQGMQHFFPDPSGPQAWSSLYELGNPDLVKVAEGLGADAYAVNDPADLQAIMPQVLHAQAQGKPQVIVANINTQVLPPYYEDKYNQAPPSHG